MKKPKILVVDDDQLALTALRELLSDDYAVIAVNSGRESIEAIQTTPEIETVVMDIRMPGMDGIDAARQIRRLAPNVPVIFHTGYAGDYKEDHIKETEQPFDYVKKSGEVSILLRAIRNGVAAYGAKVNKQQLAERANNTHKIIGQSEALLEVLRAVRQVARTECSVMLRGESGVGKTLFAEVIHNSSARKDRPFIIVSASHYSTDLTESNLFGHVKGAFTGAVCDRTGCFELANGGTILLDEIGDLDVNTQIKLLRAVDTGEFCRLGESVSRKTDARIICATHRDLEQMVSEETFREDLYYRLCTVKITIPSLRDRTEDIPLLAKWFVDDYAKREHIPPKILDHAAIDVLKVQSWRANVRHLFHVLESVLVTTDSDLILADDIARVLGLESYSEHSDTRNGSLSEMVRAYKKKLILEALKESKSNVAAAARQLSVDRANLRKMIIDLGIDME